MEERSGQVKWLIRESDIENLEIDSEKVAAPKYSAFGERIRHVAPSSLTCSMFCGGKQCKYCNPGKFKDEEMAINGLYSSWITDKILATSRPSTDIIAQFNILDQFHKNKIKSIINLQLSGEHAACGNGLEPGGFSYVSQEFMDNEVFFYNFGWNDYGVRSLQSILDMVKVMDFAISNGKVAVHCHAGLGRTGVLIACYIIYSERATAEQAIVKMRQTRPKAIQTRGQINCVKDFASYLRPMWMVFAEDDKHSTLSHTMNRQRHLLHGEEARTLKYIPKIIFTICDRLLKFARIEFDLSSCARITHYSFMKNSTYNTSNRSNTNTNHNKTTSGTDNSSNTLIVLNDLHKGYSATNLNELAGDLKSIDEQFKASSTPNVSFVTDKEYDTSDEKDIVNKKILLKKSVLEPIKARKKKGLIERLTKSKPADKNGDASVLSISFDSGIYSTSNKSDEFSLSASVDSRFNQRRCSDNVSISSFSNSNELSPSELVLKHLAFRSTSIDMSNKIDRLKFKLNKSDQGWKELCEETNIAVLSGVLWQWLSQLQGPIISLKCIELMNTYLSTPTQCFPQLDRNIWKLMECFITCLSKFDDKQCIMDRILRRFAAVMTGDNSIPRNVSSAIENGDEECTPGVVFFHFCNAWLNLLNSN